MRSTRHALNSRMALESKFNNFPSTCTLLTVHRSPYMRVCILRGCQSPHPQVPSNEHADEPSTASTAHHDENLARRARSRQTRHAPPSPGASACSVGVGCEERRRGKRRKEGLSDDRHHLLADSTPEQEAYRRPWRYRAHAPARNGSGIA